MGLLRNFCRLVTFCTVISTLFVLSLTAVFLLHTVPPLYQEYKLQRPNDHGSDSLFAQLEQLLFPERFNVNRLNTFNYKHLLHLSSDQFHSTKHNQSYWIYITGNQTCNDDLDGEPESVKSAAPCQRFDAALAEVVAPYYVQGKTSLPNNASVFTLNCDISPFLCDAWAVSPPGLVKMESKGECGFSFNGMFPQLKCPYAAWFLYLPLSAEFYELAFPKDKNLLRTLPDEKTQLRTLLESSYLHEAGVGHSMMQYVGNGGEVQEFSELLGELVAGFPTADLYSGWFAWWLGEDWSVEDAEDADLPLHERAENRSSAWDFDGPPNF